METIAEWILRMKSKHNDRNEVVWLETTAQHWLTKAGNGYYNSGDDARHQVAIAEATNLTTMSINLWHTNVSCSAIKKENDWRNAISRETLDRMTNNRIKYFHLNGTTQLLADMHISHPYNMDCTHYCFMPLLWQPLWHYMASIADMMKI